jgi:hypothetical protein
MTYQSQGNASGFGGLESMLSNFMGGQHDQVPDEQVHASYGQYATQLPQDQYVSAARDAFDQLSPQQREEFARELQAKAQHHGYNVPSNGNDYSSDSESLANTVGNLHAQQPNAMQEMFAPGGMFSSPIAKAALLGVTAMAAQRLMGGRR